MLSKVNGLYLISTVYTKFHELQLKVGNVKLNALASKQQVIK